MFRRGGGRHARIEAERADRGFDGLDDPTGNYLEANNAPARDDVTSASASRSLISDDELAPLSVSTSGPFDSGALPIDNLTRVDLGALRVPVLPGVNIHPQVEDDHISAIVLVQGNSALQVIPFAAPREDGAWDDIRHDLRIKLEAENYAPRECEGEFDLELLANLPTQNGRQLVRFLGIDGPRWFIRAMFTGAAASDPAASKILLDVLRNTIVVRGIEPRPVRDPLPMRMPEPATTKPVAPEQPIARVASQVARETRLAGESRPPRERIPARSSYLADATYRERYGPVADETIEIRGLPFLNEDELALTH